MFYVQKMTTVVEVLRRINFYIFAVVVAFLGGSQWGESFDCLWLNFRLFYGWWLTPLIPSFNFFFCRVKDTWKTRNVSSLLSWTYHGSLSIAGGGERKRGKKSLPLLFSSTPLEKPDTQVITMVTINKTSSCFSSYFMVNAHAVRFIIIVIYTYFVQTTVMFWSTV